MKTAGKSKKSPQPTGNWLQGNWKHSENSRKKLGNAPEKLQNRTAGERPKKNRLTKKSNHLETVGHLYKMRFKNGSLILPFLHDTAKKKAHDIFFVMGLCLDVTKMIPRKLGCQFVSVQSLRKVGHPYKTCAINCSSILQFLSDTTKKKVHDIFSVMDSKRKERDSNPWGL